MVLPPPPYGNQQNCLTYMRYYMFMTGYEYVLPAETTVYGIAATIFRKEENDVDSAGYTMLLYTLVDDSILRCIDSITSYSRATHFVYSASDGNEVLDSAAPCYEYYFSRPHVLSGTIYIGSRLCRGYIVQGPGMLLNPRCSAIDRTGSQRWVSFPSQDSISTGISTGMASYWGGYFPIIQPERIGCEAAEAEVVERGDDYAVLEWAMGGDSCQLSVAPYDMPVDSGLVVDLTATSYTATGLDTGVYYAARLRTQCHHSCHIHADTVVWSDWGAPTMFYLGSEEPDTTGIGIRRVEAPVEFSVTPNPARGLATVRCAAGLQTVELLGVKGDVLLRREAAGSEGCVLDLTGLAKGIYIVRITTSRGTAAQKLAVE